MTEVLFLTFSELFHVAERAIGAPPDIRDAGLLEAALARPRASAFGTDAYPTLPEKAAALVHSLARNHALVDGNKRLALSGLIAFVGINGFRFTLTNDQAYDLIIEIATGNLDDIPTLARRIGASIKPRT